MKIYVSASSQEIERARNWMQALREADFEVTSTWIEKIAEVGVANPRTASKKDRRRWASVDLEEVTQAHLFWMLAPEQGAGRGAYAELGFSIGGSCGTRRHVISGDTEQSIFCALATEYSTDARAFEAICDYRDMVEGR